jgi:nucleotide-binding universal stress UspA family protein
MPKRSSIIVATDGREQSDGALRAAAWLAKTVDAWKIISVVPPFPLVSAELDLHITAEAADASRSARRRIVAEQVQRLLGDDVNGDIDVRSGHPADLVCRAAEEADAKLIV